MVSTIGQRNHLSMVGRGFPSHSGELLTHPSSCHHHVTPFSVCFECSENGLNWVVYTSRATIVFQHFAQLLHHNSLPRSRSDAQTDSTNDDRRTLDCCHGMGRRDGEQCVGPGTLRRRVGVSDL